MTATIAINPTESNGVEINFSSLPYDYSRVALDCGHSFLYVTQNYKDQPPLCGLCLFREGFESELPGRIHVSVNPRYRVLAANGNLETAPKFLSHLYLVMGLKGPKAGEALHIFRRARGHYTKPAKNLFPVASALWKLMGYQPPLGVVLVQAVNRSTEQEIAKHLDDSIMNIHLRMAKAINTAMKYLPKDHLEN